MANITIDRLLNLVPDSPDTVASHLASNPALAGAQDAHGYSLVHAASSYGHASLLKTLVNEYHVDVNIQDEDGETPLFAAENVEIARTLVEELHADVNARNEEGQTAEEKLVAEAEWPLVAAYLRQVAGSRSGGGAASVIAQTGGANDTAAAQAGTVEGGAQINGGHPPPPMPEGVDIKIGTMAEPGEDEGQPDPEFRRRIEELAARDDFQSEEGQRQLRELIQDAVSGMSGEGQGSGSRRRVD